MKTSNLLTMSVLSLIITSCGGNNSSKPPTLNVCDNIDCGGHGSCVVTANNTPTCECEVNYQMTMTGDIPTCVASSNKPGNPCEGVRCNDRGKCVVTDTNEAKCECDDGFELDNQDHTKCLPIRIDNNHNYMWDGYETAVNQGKDCRTHSDCDSSVGKGDGFCDSFIDYKCSTKCTKNDECINDNYICREDGRCAPEEFVTVWKIDSENKTVKFPAGKIIEDKNGKEINCNYTIDWGDGTEKTKVTKCPEDEEFIEHTYSLTGTSQDYVIKVTGSIPGWACRLSWDPYCSGLTEVKSFGPVMLANHAFYEAKQLTKVSEIDIPNSKYLTDLGDTFNSTEKFNSDIGRWDTSNVTNMANMFSGALVFNQSIGKWDTSKVTNMSYMFSDAKVFNRDISNWNTSNVTDMSIMFNGAEVFNQPIGKWNTSKVADMGDMFNNASAFNQDISKWDTSNVTNMSQMFFAAHGFDNAGSDDIGNWNTSKVENMSGMFQYTKEFNRDISKWNTKNVTDMSRMFYKAEKFNQNISGWNVCAVESYNEFDEQANEEWTTKPYLGDLEKCHGTTTK